MFKQITSSSSIGARSIKPTMISMNKQAFATSLATTLFESHIIDVRISPHTGKLEYQVVNFDSSATLESRMSQICKQVDDNRNTVGESFVKLRAFVSSSSCNILFLMLYTDSF